MGQESPGNTQDFETFKDDFITVFRGIGYTRVLNYIVAEATLANRDELTEGLHSVYTGGIKDYWSPGC